MTENPTTEISWCDACGDEPPCSQPCEECGRQKCSICGKLTEEPNVCELHGPLDGLRDAVTLTSENAKLRDQRDQLLHLMRTPYAVLVRIEP